MIFLLPVQQLPINTLDTLAQKRDVPGLQRFLADPKGKNPFSIIKTGGGYVAGAMGWHAKLLVPKDGTERYVVFTTPIIEEDNGELLFRVTTQQKLQFVPERETMGVELDHHSFDVSFDLANHKAIVTDRIQCRWSQNPGAHFVFRVSPTFQ